MRFEVTLVTASHGKSYTQYAEGRLNVTALETFGTLKEATRFVDFYELEDEEDEESSVLITVTEEK